MRALRLALVTTLSAAGCIKAAPTGAETATETVVVTRVGRAVSIGEPRVAMTVAAMASRSVALDIDSPGLQERATVSDANARVIALQRHPGGTVVEAELEEDDGRLVYAYKIRSDDVRSKVEIDATTEAVLSEKRKKVDDASRPSDR
jgi:hypothetical protein